MRFISPEIADLIRQIGRLPYMGGRAAERLVLFLLENKVLSLEPLLGALESVSRQSVICSECGNIDTQSPCRICSSRAREGTQMCLVSSVSDLWTFERADFYRGMYFVLGAKSSQLGRLFPEEIDVDGLVRQIEKRNVEEIIFAFNADLTSQTLTLFLLDQLSSVPVRITGLSKGIPIGGEIERLDYGTLITAFDQRVEVK